MVRLERVAGIILLVVGLLGCGGTDSMLPAFVRDSLKTTEAALEQGDEEEICQAMSGTQSALYEWQEYARGNMTMLVVKFLADFESLSYECMMQQPEGPAEMDLDRLSERYSEWSSLLGKKTTRKSGFMIWFIYILIPAVIGGVLMFWRRKFREA